MAPLTALQLNEAGIETLVAASAGALCVTEAGKVQFVMVTLVVAEQPKASVTVNTCTPGPRWNTPVPVYGAVPAEAETVTLALPLKTVTAPAEDETVSAEGNITAVPVETAVVLFTQPLVTVIAHRTVASVLVGVMLKVGPLAPTWLMLFTDH